jgi:hypothetical protein
MGCRNRSAGEPGHGTIDPGDRSFFTSPGLAPGAEEGLATSLVTAHRGRSLARTAEAAMPLPGTARPRSRQPVRRPARQKSAAPQGLAVANGRYRLRRTGRDRALTCCEAPTLTVRIEPGSCVSAAAARSAPPGTIYLDGAAQGEPFIDAERDVYNLDHHEGCVRAFTLASCEQAMVLLRRGLDLRRRDFTVVANGTDLDTVLAIWVLLNHLRLTPEESPTRARMLPLLRLEGNIDALGLGSEDLCGLPSELLQETRAKLDALLERERAAHTRGLGRDALAFVAAQLRAIDRFAYAGEELGEGLEIEEIARAELEGAGVAVVCRSDGGIYEVERELRRLHGARLGLVVLQKDAQSYSLRAAHPTAAAQLGRIYTQLNRIDPGSDGNHSANRWGGAGEIGGSPRGRGTRLDATAIADACRDACVRWTPGGRLRRLAATSCAAASLLALGLAPLALPLGEPDAALSAVILFLVTSALCAIAGARAPGFYGLRVPRGFAGWPWLPVAVAAGAAGGVWLPAVALPQSLATAELLSVCALFAAPAALELLFRGFVTARLLPAFPKARPSWVPLLPAIGYAALIAALPSAVAPLGGPWTAPLAAFIFGLASGAARERSESLLQPLLFAWLGAAALLARNLLGV